MKRIILNAVLALSILQMEGFAFDRLASGQAYWGGLTKGQSSRLLSNVIQNAYKYLDWAQEGKVNELTKINYKICSVSYCIDWFYDAAFQIQQYETVAHSADGIKTRISEQVRKILDLAQELKNTIHLMAKQHTFSTETLNPSLDILRSELDELHSRLRIAGILPTTEQFHPDEESMPK
ncbi:MAG: hypothetical protein LBJ77_03185 [Holosporales bacterium]|nr:hypothetical protein [Holosporales bacterium]